LRQQRLARDKKLSLVIARENFKACFLLYKRLKCRKLAKWRSHFEKIFDTLILYKIQKFSLMQVFCIAKI